MRKGQNKAVVAFVPQEMIEAIREAVIYLAHTHDGARVAMHCLWHGTPKVSVAQGPAAFPSTFPSLVFPRCV